ncbi:MAG TPA: c-type cytochrome [Burkholderiales bacterium]|nr:c-type cytochrome [Burkholderiales bacterium]
MAVALTFVSATESAQKKAPPMPQKAVVCAACHGSAGVSTVPNTPSLARQQAEFLVLQLFLMREGLRAVPEMKGMLNGWSDADLESVGAYYASQAAPASGSKRDPKLHARGAQIARAMGCGICHLDDYTGQRQVPRLANQREDYLASAMKAYRDNRRTGADTNMNGIMQGMSDADVHALAHYFANQ